MNIKKKKVSVFDDLKEGLEAAIAFEKGEKVLGVRTTSVVIMPVRKRSPTQIRALRMKLNMSQAFFADVLGVTKKAVEAWEAGTKNPSGPVLRMFEILEKEVRVLERVGIFVRNKSA